VADACFGGNNHGHGTLHVLGAVSSVLCCEALPHTGALLHFEIQGKISVVQFFYAFAAGTGMVHMRGSW
jgi:hypothetical protein